MMEFLLGHSLWAFRSGELAFARGWPTWLLIALAAAGLIAIVATLLRRKELGPLQRVVIAALQFRATRSLEDVNWNEIADSFLEE